MSNRYWSKWGNVDRQTFGHDGLNYYLRTEDSNIEINPDELDDLVYKMFEVRRKVEEE